MLSSRCRLGVATSLAVLSALSVVTYVSADEGPPPIQVRGDNKGGAVETTVSGLGRSADLPGVRTAPPAVETALRGGGPSCTEAFAGDDGQAFRETRNGVDGRYYFVNCSDGTHGLTWAPDSPSPPGRGASALAAVSMAELARQASDRLPLPAPVVKHSPDRVSGRPETVVGFRTWFWVDPASYRPLTQTVTAGAVTATVTARPVSTHWVSGSPDAPDVTCPGPGVPYDPRLDSSVQSTYCATTYARSSARRPQTGPDANDRFFLGSATTRWQVSWTGTGGVQGQLPDLERTSTFQLAVAELQAVNY